MMDLEQEIKDRINHFYKQLDGSYNFPNSAEGDLIKLVYKYMVEKGKCPCGGYFNDYHTHASDCSVIGGVKVY